MPGARRRVSYFIGTFSQEKEPRPSARRALQRKLGPLTDSGTTLFDNSKAGNFMPITPGRLRSAWGTDGMIYYQFCSSMLSSTVDLQGELSQVLEEGRVDSPTPNRGEGKNGAARIEAYDSAESCGIATATSIAQAMHCDRRRIE